MTSGLFISGIDDSTPNGVLFSSYLFTLPFPRNFFKISQPLLNISATHIRPCNTRSACRSLSAIFTLIRYPQSRSVPPRRRLPPAPVHGIATRLCGPALLRKLGPSSENSRPTVRRGSLSVSHGAALKFPFPAVSIHQSSVVWFSRRVAKIDLLVAELNFGLASPTNRSLD